MTPEKLQQWSLRIFWRPGGGSDEVIIPPVRAETQLPPVEDVISEQKCFFYPLFINQTIEGDENLCFFFNNLRKKTVTAGLVCEFDKTRKYGFVFVYVLNINSYISFFVVFFLG